VGEFSLVEVSKEEGKTGRGGRGEPNSPKTVLGWALMRLHPPRLALFMETIASSPTPGYL